MPKEIHALLSTEKKPNQTNHQNNKFQLTTIQHLPLRSCFPKTTYSSFQYLEKHKNTHKSVAVLCFFAFVH
jgi:hypothetical protein